MNPKTYTKRYKALVIVQEIVNEFGKDIETSVRSQTIQAIQDVCQMSKSGATTYFYNALKKIST